MRLHLPPRTAARPFLPRLAAVLLWSAALFPLGRWWCLRLAEPLDTSLLSAISLALLIAIAWRNASPTSTLPAWKLLLAAGGLSLFGLLHPSLPLTLAAVPAVLAGLPLLLPENLPQGKYPLPLAALAFLVLPSVMILDLFLGVPLRALAVSGAAELLKICGFEVAQRGFELTVGGQALWMSAPVEGQTLWVDAPCAGVKMLATGAWLACVLAQIFQLNARRTLALGGLSLFLLVACNAMRVAVLTGCEAVGHHLSPTAHSLVGLLALVPGVVTCAVAAAGLGPRPPSAESSIGNLQFSIFRRGIFRRGTVPFRLSRGTVPFRLAMGTLVLATGFCLYGNFRKGTVPVSGEGTVPFETTAAFPGWPATFEGTDLTPAPLAQSEVSFAEAFPGKIGNFKCGNAQVILRWTDRPTHRVHSASACLAASGWQLTPLPLVRRADGDWSAFRATKGGQSLTLREQVRAADGTTLSDIPTWFTQALLGRTKGPWWIVTVAARQDLRP